MMSRRPVKVKLVECIECPYYKLIPLEMCVSYPALKGGACSTSPAGEGALGGLTSRPF